MATSRPFTYNSSQATIYCADNFSTLSVGAFSTDFSSKPGGLTWWMGPDEDTGYIIAIPVPAGNMPSPIGNIATVKFFVTTAFNDSEFITLSKIVTGQTFANAAAARTYLVSNGYWTNYLDADAQTFITSAGITSATQKMAINNLVTNLKLQNLWSKMTTVYPIVGGNVTAHSKNLINPSTYPISFSSGWTHTSEGIQAATPMSGAYADTGIQAGNISGDVHISAYCATDSADYGVLISLEDGYDSDGYVATNRYFLSAGGTKGFGTSSDTWFNSNPDVYGSSGDYNTSFGHFINTTTGNREFFKSYINGILKYTIGGGGPGIPTGRTLLIGNTYDPNYGTPGNNNNTKMISFVTVGTSLTDTDALNLSTTIEKFQNALSRGKSPVLTYDSDLTNFLLRIYATGGTVSRNELSNLVTLVNYLKSKGLWNRLSAFYPMVGGTSASCAQNLISSSFTGTFTSGWTFNYLGALPNGSSAYMNTNFNLLDHGIDNNSGAFGVYLNTSRADSTQKGHGALAGSGFPASYIFPFASSSMFAGINNNLGGASISSSDTLGMFQTSRISSTQQILFKNSTGTVFNQAPYSRNNFNLYLGAVNVNGPTFYDDARIASAYVTKYGLTSTELTDMYTGVHNFNTALARPGGKPVFADPDVNSYFDRMYSAGGTCSGLEALAVNSLALELKAKGLWTKMVAVYPFAGSSATSNSQNLISSSFTGTFSGTWTSYTNGPISGGGFFNTGFIPSTHASINGVSFGGIFAGYMINYSDPGAAFGAFSGTGQMYFQRHTQYNNNNTRFGLIGGSQVSGNQISANQIYSIGNVIFRRTSSTFAQGYYSTSFGGSLISLGTSTTNASGLPTHSFYFGALNLNGSVASPLLNVRNSIGFLGLDLTSQQTTDLNTAMNNYYSARS
jgi:hypothetical protein